jgi:hypothetical protein
VNRRVFLSNIKYVPLVGLALPSIVMGNEKKLARFSEDKPEILSAKRLNELVDAINKKG